LIVNACKLKDKHAPEKGCVNLRVKNIPSKFFTDKNVLLRDIGWHTTFMSTIIYNQNLLKNFDKNKYKNTIFPQFVLLYHYLGKKDKIKVYFDKRPAVYTLNTESLKGTTWFKDIIKIFTKDWYEAVFSLPESYTYESKLTCIRNHDKYTGVFSPLKLLYIRSFGYLNKNIFKKYKKYIKDTVNTPEILIYLASIFPKFLAVFMRDTYLKMRGGY
ncbi:MAG: hypothetical protein GXO21_01570, partial [Aquificae bacterium]|nr:hypothetical protein [Aquificota bacterium]